MNPTKYTENMPIPECGFVTGMPNSVYQAVSTHVSNSRMKLMQQSAFHYFNPSPFTDTRPKQIGSAIHAAILEPKKFADDYMLLPELENRQKPEYKSACLVVGKEKSSEVNKMLPVELSIKSDKQLRELGSSFVFAGLECQNIEDMFNAVYANDDAANLLTTDGHCELSGFCTCPRTGLKLRVRFDKLLNTNEALDIKKTQSVHDDDLSKTIWNYDYHIQAAFYSYCYEIITGKKLDRFSFIFVEEKYPQKVAVRYLDDISFEIGMNTVNELLDKIKHYTDNGVVPENNEPSSIISLPEFVMRQYEDDIF